MRCALTSCAQEFTPEHRFQRYCSRICEGTGLEADAVAAKLSARAAYLEQPTNRIRHLYNNAVQRAKKLRVPCEASLLPALLQEIPACCACCGASFDYTTGRGKQHAVTARSPSLDRLLPTDGWTMTNTTIICARCHRLKSDASINELQAIIRYMETAPARLRHPSPTAALKQLTEGTGFSTAADYDEDLAKLTGGGEEA